MLAVDGASKRCARCLEDKPLSSYCKAGGRRTGHQAYCKPCARAYYRSQHKDYNNKFQRLLREKKQTHVRTIKTEHGCAECGERREPCLEFHHEDPRQKVAGVWKLAASNASYERIDAEIAKCVVLCCNCHRIHHHNERQARKRESA